MKFSAKRMVSLILVIMLLCALTAVTASAAGTDAAPAAESASAPESSTNAKAIAAAALVGLVATAGALGMALAIGKSADGMSRQPEASGSIRSAMMLGLVFNVASIVLASLLNAMEKFIAAQLTGFPLSFAVIIAAVGFSPKYGIAAIA